MESLSTKILAFLIERGWENLSPGDLAKSICIESSELLEIFQWSNPSAEELLSDPDKIRNVSDEIADVIIYALEMCVILRLNPEEVVSAKLDKAAAKYPAEAMIRNRDEGPANSEYHDIKARHRYGRDRSEDR